MKEVNSKSTKTEILDALAEAKKEIAVLKSNRPTAVISQEKAVQETVKKVEDTIAEVVKTPVDVLKDISTEVNGYFGKLIDKLNAKTQEFNDVCIALGAKKKELQDIYGISAEADTLEALIKANANKKETLEATYTERKAEIQDEINQLEVKRDGLQAEYDKAYEDYSDKLLKEREQEQEQFDYDLKIKRRDENDTWEQSKKEREAIVAGKEAAVRLREDAITARETEIAEMEKTIAEMPKKLAEAEDKGEKRGKAIAENSAKTEAKILAAEVTGREALANAEIANLKAQLEAERTKNTAIEAKLNTAYDKIESIAKATVDNKNLTDVMDTLKKAVSDTKNNGK